jgi:hypothetical protein
MVMSHLGSAYLAALRELVARLHARGGDAPVRWALTGSASFALQGVPVDVHDLDVQTDSAGAYEIARRFADCVSEPVHYWDSGTMRSHFGALTVLGIRVEVMGDITKRRADDTWEPPPDLVAITRWVTLADLRLPVLALEYEERAYRTMGRTARADLLRCWLASTSENG